MAQRVLWPQLTIGNLQKGDQFILPNVKVNSKEIIYEKCEYGWDNEQMGAAFNTKTGAIHYFFWNTEVELI